MSEAAAPVLRETQVPGSQDVGSAQSKEAQDVRRTQPTEAQDPERALPPGVEIGKPARTPGLQDVKRGAMTVFSMGDYSKIALRLEAASKRLVADCRLEPGDRVLDVAAGNGNVAVSAARRGARVVALDLTTAMVQAGRRRTSVSGLDVEWIRGDAEALPFADEQFDCVASVFGASMAPQPAMAAEELFRVVRPGGKVAMANWTSEGLASKLGAIMTSYLGSPPMRQRKKHPRTYGWGHEDGVRELFQKWADEVSFRRSILRSKFKCFESYQRFQEANFGALMLAKRKLPTEQYEEMVGEIRVLTLAANTSPDGALWIDNEYLQVIAIKKPAA